MAKTDKTAKQQNIGSIWQEFSELGWVITKVLVANVLQHSLAKGC